jgi:hypothetical protein
MADCLVDTNVLIVGSAAVEPKYSDVSVNVDQIEVVYNWLSSFRDDPSRSLVLDEAFRIYNEYRHKLNDQHFGLQVVHHKFNQFQLRCVSVEYDHNGYGVVPPGLEAIDHSDKKFVAAALNDPENIHIVNATDSDWKQHRAALESHGIVVVELLP